MGLHNELPVYKASYDLLLEIFQFTKDFSKDFKYTVGESLKNETIELVTLISTTTSPPTSFLQIDTARRARHRRGSVRLGDSSAK